MRRLTILFAVIALVLMTTYIAAACPACYGDKDSPITAGMNTAILVMLGITGGMLSLIVTFFVMMWKRYKSYQNQILQAVFVNDGSLLEKKNH